MISRIYFRTTNPVVEDIMDVVNSYNCYIPLLDYPFSIDEFNTAINEIGKGTGLDGLEPKVAHLFPMTVRLEPLKFINIVFENPPNYVVLQFPA